MHVLVSLPSPSWPCALEPQALHTVGWLDLTAAKVRFGLWLGGIMPQLTDWDAVMAARPPAGTPFGSIRSGGDDGDSSSSQSQLQEQQPSQPQPQQQQQQRGGGGSARQAPVKPAIAAAAEAGAAAAAALHLRGLSHPLLLADYRERRGKLEQQIRMARVSGGYGGSSSSSGVGGSSGQKKQRLLPSRKEVMAQ